MKQLLLSFVPAMITGGPLFLAIAAGQSMASSPSTSSLYLTLAGYAGAVALSLGLAVMFRLTMHQERVILELERRLTAGGTSDA